MRSDRSSVLGALLAVLLGASACGASGNTIDVEATNTPDAASAAPAPSPSAAPLPPRDVDAGPGPHDAAVDAKESGGPFTCTKDGAFPSVLAIAEASAAAEVELLPGVRELLVVSDSGHNGAAMLLKLGGGGGSRTITLPLDAAGGDDIEGIAWRGGKLYTLTSSGAVRRFSPDGTGKLVRDQDTYAVGPAPYACADLTAVNCGKNYEGLCLRDPAIAHPCAGYAASKAEGKLHCVTIDALGRLAIDTTKPALELAVAGDRLSDCAFGAPGGGAAGALVVATNVYNLSRTYRVNETSGALTALPTTQLLNTEAIAIDRDGALYVFDDNSQGQSSAAKTVCIGW